MLCVLGRILCAFLQDGPRGLLLQVGTRRRERERITWVTKAGYKVALQRVLLFIRGIAFALFASNAFLFNVRLPFSSLLFSCFTS